MFKVIRGDSVDVPENDCDTSDDSIVEEVKKYSCKNQEDENEGEHAEELPKLTEILDAFSVVRNSFKQQSNVFDDIFLNSMKSKHFTKKL